MIVTGKAVYDCIVIEIEHTLILKKQTIHPNHVTTSIMKIALLDASMKIKERSHKDLYFTIDEW